MECNEMNYMGEECMEYIKPWIEGKIGRHHTEYMRQNPMDGSYDMYTDKGIVRLIPPMRLVWNSSNGTFSAKKI